MEFAEELDLKNWEQCYPKILGSTGSQFWGEVLLKEREYDRIRFYLAGWQSFHINPALNSLQEMLCLSKILELASQ